MAFLRQSRPAAFSNLRDGWRQWEMGSVFPRFPLNIQEVAKGEEIDPVEATGTVDAALSRKLHTLLQQIPGRVGVHRAYVHYCAQERAKAADGSARTGSGTVPDFESFRTAYAERHNMVLQERRRIRNKKRNKMKNYGVGVDNSEMNQSGSVAPEDEDCKTALGDEENSLLYDRYLAELYERKHAAANDLFGQENRPRRDSVTDVARAAFRDHVLDQSRPVLSHELADYKTPYMMKRGAQRRLLQLVARNPLEERLIEKTLNRRPDLIKARVQADLPPEALEPLYAFLGHRNWSFDARERLGQQLNSAESALQRFESERNTNSVKLGSGNVESNTSSSSKDKKKTKKVKKSAKTEDDSQESNEDSTVPTDSESIRPQGDPSLGFASQIPRPTDFIGSLRSGKPHTRFDRYLAKKRYPTLQLAAQRLPRDPVYRSHVLRTVRILERNPHWDLKSKFEAVDTLKEVYDHLDPSDKWRNKLDTALPMFVPSKRRRNGYTRSNRYQYNHGRVNSYYRHWFPSHDNSLRTRSKLKV